MKTNTLAILSTHIMVILMLPNISFAEDQIYPGSMCKAYFANQQGYLKYIDGATLVNNSNYVVWVACPVPKDPIRQASNQYALVNVMHSGNIIDTYICKFFNKERWTGDIINFDSDGVSSYWAGRDETVSMSLPRFDNTVSSIACRVPPLSELRNYNVREY